MAEASGSLISEFIGPMRLSTYSENRLLPIGLIFTYIVSKAEIANNGGWLEFQGLRCSLSAFSTKETASQKIGIYDMDGKGKVTFNDIIEVLKDLTGPFMSDKQREDVLCQLLAEADYTRES